MPVPLSDDPWLALDKAEHLIFCALVAACAYLVARTRPALARWRLAAGATASFLAGAAKEAGDAAGLWPGRPSWRDAAADAVGGAAALAALAYVDADRPEWLDRVAPRARVDDVEGVALRP